MKLKLFSPRFVYVTIHKLACPTTGYLRSRYSCTKEQQPTIKLRRLIPLLLSVATSHWKEEVIPLFPNDSPSIHIDNDS